MYIIILVFLYLKWYNNRLIYKINRNKKEALQRADRIEDLKGHGYAKAVDGWDFKQIYYFRDITDSFPKISIDYFLTRSRTRKQVTCNLISGY